MVNQKGLIQYLLIVIMLLGIGVAIYLTQFTQVFKPKASSNQTEFYVSPTGNDSNEGTISSPFKTLDRAKFAVRAVNQSGNRIQVWLRGGIYELSSPFILEPEDSGYNGQYVVYQGYPGETVVISGGKQITGWTQEGDKWKAPSEGIQTRQLFINGTRATRARSEASPSGVIVDKNTGFTTTDTTYQNFKNKTDMEVAVNAIWRHFRCPITSITGSNIAIKQPCWQSTQDYGQAFPLWVENAYELLDQPGEWYLDKPSQTFYYKPRPGENMADAYIVAPVLETLVSGKGTPENPLHHVAFQDLRFEYTTWLEPSTQGYIGGQSSVYLKPAGGFAVNHAALEFETARNISFVLNTLQRLGTAGIGFGFGSKENLIMASHFTDISAEAINIGGVDHNQNLEGIPDNQITWGNQVASNYIHDVGVEYSGSSGIAVLFAQATQVSFNEVTRVPYTAISLNNVPASEVPTISKGNRIANNLIYDHVRVMTDGGGIYVNGLQPGSVIAENVIHDQYGLPGAIYLDGATRWNVINNVVYGLRSAAPFNTPQTYPIRPFNAHGCENVAANNYWTVLPGPDGGPLMLSQNISGQQCPNTNNVTNNTVITNVSQAPQDIVNKAGIQTDFKKIKDINLNPPLVTLTAPAQVSKTDTTTTFSWNFLYGADGFERVNPYELGAPDSQPLGSVYLSCTGQPSAPIVQGSCQIPNVFAADPAKKYEFRMFAKDGVTVIAKSNPIELVQTTASPSPSPSPSASAAGGGCSKDDQCPANYSCRQVQCFQAPCNNQCLPNSPLPSSNISPEPLASVKPGDADGDGDIDIFDFNLVVTEFGKTNDSATKADLDDDNDVDIFDYNLVVTNFNK